MNKKALLIGGILVIAVVVIGLSTSGKFFQGEFITNNGTNIKPNKPASSATMKTLLEKPLALPAVMQWEDGGDSDNGPQKIRNYRWRLDTFNEKKGKTYTLWERDWHDSDASKVSSDEKSCMGNIPGAPYAWTCTHVRIPEGMLITGEYYIFTVYAGDGSQESEFPLTFGFNAGNSGISKDAEKGLKSEKVDSRKQPSLPQSKGKTTPQPFPANY